MKVILANPRGFCAGVNMAVDSLEEAIKLFGTPIYAYHEIVHNRPVVERFRAKGVIFVESIQEIPEGETVLYSAHGVAPEIRRLAAERGLRHRRHLPAGYQSSLGSRSLRQGTLPHHLDRA